MLLLRWLLVVGLLAGLGLESAAQPFLGGSLSISRGRRFRLDVGFGCAPVGCNPYGPCFGPPWGTSIQYVQVMPVVQPVVLFGLPPLVSDLPWNDPLGDLLPPRLPRMPQRPPEAPPPAPPVPPREPAPPAPLPPRKELPEDLFPRPPASPMEDSAEHAQQVFEGREAFRLQEYGRAAARFRQAIRLDPKPALPWFLLAQAQVALGKYYDASDALVEGLTRQPDWPASQFRPLDLYGEPLDYGDHQRRLADTVRRHPGDTLLHFVYGYQLWFDGRQDEAIRQGARALAGARRASEEPLRQAIQAILRATTGGESF